MRRQIGLKRSFNYEDLASIVESATTSQSHDSSHHIEKRRHKRIRTCSSMPPSFSEEELSSAELDGHRSNARLISPTASRDRVTITPESSPSMQSMADSHASPFTLSSDCPATAALNRSMQIQLSSNNDWDSAFFPLEEGKEECHEDAWPVASSPTSLDMFPVRRVTLTSRTCSLRQDDKNEAKSDMGKLQTAFSLLSLPNRRKDGPKKMSRLASNRF
ncbi:hypothetical protein ACHAWO_003894 [Cyclotella atomus]|uniref:Uncharacterized protein n=1 Tax=Cyclotella atomus TaxID=382360 RepID=A0ABD3MQ80_9STRA